jgi:sulfide dehydrogenase cytochrome subunit
MTWQERSRLFRCNSLSHPGIALLGIFISTVATAQQLSAEGLADACTGCHGIGGRSQGYIPSIAGLDKATLLREIRSFRDQKADATIMNRITRGYTETELDAVAGYFSAMPKP